MAEWEIADWLRYSCSGCGSCCRRGFVIACPAADRARFLAVDWPARHPRLSAGELFAKTSGGYRFALDDSGACRFLDEDNLCIMHRELGFAAKAPACKLFPFSFVRSGGRVRVGLSFSCPAVADAAGAPLRAQTSLLRELLQVHEALRPPPAPEETADFDGRRRIPLRNLDLLEKEFITALRDPALPFCRRALLADELLERLAATDDPELPLAAFRDALRRHADRARDFAANSGLARPQLGLGERLRLRQFLGLAAPVAETALLSASFRRRAGAHLARLAESLRYLRGAGKIQILAGATDFAQAESASAYRLPEESAELLGRYLATQLAGRSYFGAAGWELPVAAGLRLTLLLGASALWHAKVAAAAAGRDAVEHADVRYGVIATDRAFRHAASFRSGAGRYLIGALLRPHCAARAFLALSLPPQR